MTQQEKLEFWMKVYIAHIQAGKFSTDAKTVADRAIKELEERFGR